MEEIIEEWIPFILYMAFLLIITTAASIGTLIWLLFGKKDDKNPE